MPQIIIKPRPDRDEYVVWSTVIESPLCAGTREQLIDYLANHISQKRGADGAAECMARVDEFGTSIKPDPDSSSLWREGEWGDDSFIFEQTGYVRRGDLSRLFWMLQEGREREALDLLRPFEDPDAAGRLQERKDRLDRVVKEAAG